MHIIGPSHIAVIENVIQKMVDQIFIWCTHMYGKNEKKQRLWDPFSFLKGSSSCLMLCHLQYSFRKYYASWKGHELYVLYPHVPTPWHVFALWEFLVTLPPTLVESLFPEHFFFFFPLWRHLFWHTIPTCSRTERNASFSRATVYFPPQSPNVTQQYSS